MTSLKLWSIVVLAIILFAIPLIGTLRGMNLHEWREFNNGVILALGVVLWVVFLSFSFQP